MLGLAIAIWIPLTLRRQEMLQRNKVELAAAVMIAYSLQHMIEPIYGRLTSINDALIEGQNNKLTSQAYAQFHKILNSLSLPTEAQLLAFGLWQPDTAKKLNLACSYFNKAQAVAQNIAFQHESETPPSVEQIKNLFKCVNQALEYFVPVFNTLNALILEQEKMAN